MPHREMTSMRKYYVYWKPILSEEDWVMIPIPFYTTLEEAWKRARRCNELFPQNEHVASFANEPPRRSSYLDLDIFD
jgi:hypothetical protein